MTVAAYGTAISLPFLVGMLMFNNFYAAITMLLFEYVFVEQWFGPTMSLVQSHLPANVQGLGAALATVLTSLVSSRGVGAVTKSECT